MGFTSLFKAGTKAEHPVSARPSSTPSPPPLPPAWAWPSCKQPRTLSFRAQADRRGSSGTIDPYTIVVNSIYSDEEDRDVDEMTVGSCSFRITAAEEEDEEKGEDEDVIKGLRSDRLFFDPGGCSILHDRLSASCSSSSKDLHTAQEDNRTSRPADQQRSPSTAPSPPRSPTPPVQPLKSHEKRMRGAAAGQQPGVVAEELESENPYRDFRASMGEVATAQGLQEWDALEEMLGWYLGANRKSTHRFILAAFVDLLVAIASSPPPASERAPIASSSSPSFTTTTTSAAATANNDSDSFDSALLVCSSSCSSCSCSCSSSNSCIKFVVEEEEQDQEGHDRQHEEDDDDEDDLTEGKKATAVPDGDATDRSADD